MIPIPDASLPLSPLDPSPASSCPGCTKAETEIRTLLCYISTSISSDPSEFLGFELPDSNPADCTAIFHQWAKNFDSDPEFPLCPDLKKRIEALVYKLLNEKVKAGELRGRKRKGNEELGEMLGLLSKVAVDCCNGVGRDREWKGRIFRARKAVFLRLDGNVHYDEDFPYKKKQKTCKFLNATATGTGSCHNLNNPVRRSQRTVLKIGNYELPRKRIPIGPTFQAELPDWTAPSKVDVSEDNVELNDSRLLGTQIWPLEGDDRRVIENAIGKGRASSCNCISRGSVECIRSHVKMARLCLKSDLGPMFPILGFAEMGEEVSKTWTQEEQTKFADLVRQNPSSEGKSFLEHALEHFTSKTRKDIVSFYFNVFLLRWMSSRTMLGAQIVDSSDDESSGWG